MDRHLSDLVFIIAVIFTIIAFVAAIGTYKSAPPMFLAQLALVLMVCALYMQRRVQR
jgi:hypothetical protein